MHQLQGETVVAVRSRATTRPTVVNLVSFGFRYGTPRGAELLFDVPLPAATRTSSRALRPIDRAATRTSRDYVLKSARGAALLQRLRDLLAVPRCPLYDAEGKAYLTDRPMGCTGGATARVAVAEALASDAARASGREVNVEHRDVEKSA